MKIKSLLLGSAAAMVAATGAKAADAIVIAEPEPVEYVRVCDAYGAGFFYIPGTETCLSINGYVWAQIGASNQNRLDYLEPVFDEEEVFDGFIERRTSNYPVWSSRVRLNFDTRSDTEWGTLRGYLRVQADWNAQNQTIGTVGVTSIGDLDLYTTFSGLTSHVPTDGVAYIDQAFLQLGGFQAGYTESAWAVTQYGGVSNWGAHSWGGMSYGLQQRQSLMYGFTSNGFHATLSLEDDGNANWMPDVVGVVGYNAGWGGVWAKVAYDEDIHSGGWGPLFGFINGSWMPISPYAESSDSGWAASIGAQINVPNMPGSSLRLIGFYADSRNAYSVGSEWSVLASYRHQFSSSLAASVAVQYFNDTNFGAAGSPHRWDAELSVVWLPVTNFEVRTEIKHSKPENVDGTTSGFLRFTRYF